MKGHIQLLGITCSFINGTSEIQGAAEDGQALHCQGGWGCQSAGHVPVPGENMLFPDKSWAGETISCP